MRLLMNENISGTVIRRLREGGHDVLSVKESMQGAEDEVVLERAQMEDRLVVTQDKDFGELAFRSRLPASCGVALFRLSGVNPEEDNERIVQILLGSPEWEGFFSTVTETLVRKRLLPPEKEG